MAESIADGAPLPAFGYRSPVWWVTPVVLSVFGVVAFFMVVAALSGGGPPVPFLLFWLFAVGWNAWWFLFRIGHTVHVENGMITWRSILRVRQLPLTELTGNSRSINFGDKLLVRTGPNLLVWVGDRGWSRFLSTLNDAHPAHCFHPTRMDRVRKKWPLTTKSDGFYWGSP